MKYPDPWQTAEYVDVAARSRELGCSAPAGIALLPGNFLTAADKAEFCFHPAVPEVRSAWRFIGLVDAGPDQQAQARVAAPETETQPTSLTVFFGLELAADPRAVLPALGMIVSILTIGLRSARTRHVRFEAVVERPGGGYTCLRHHGHASDIAALARPVCGIWGVDPSKGTAAKETGAVE